MFWFNCASFLAEMIKTFKFTFAAIVLVSFASQMLFRSSTNIRILFLSLVVAILPIQAWPGNLNGM
jgi:hypothetical protein